MTSPDPFSSDPFSSDRVRDTDAHRSDEPVLNQPFPEQPAADQGYLDPATHPNQPGNNQLGYASPPVYSQPPTYAQPQYVAYHQVPPRPPVDAVSIAAFATSLLGLSPVAIILGVIGLVRTSKQERSGKWMAWTGLVLGILGTIGWALVVAAVVWVQGAIDTGSSFTPRTDWNEHQEVDPEAHSYGDDPYLDQLWDECEAGDMVACDDLFLLSRLGSEYEEFADNCGTAGRELLQMWCEN